MRLRRVLATSAAAIALVVALPGASYAADGTFSYSYYDSDGVRVTGTLEDPQSGQCIDLPEVVSGDADVAFAPQNGTNSTVTMFTDVDCDGDYYSLRPGGRASDRLLLRSVVFS